MSEKTYALALAGIGVASAFLPYLTKDLHHTQRLAPQTQEVYVDGIRIGTITGITAGLAIAGAMGQL